MVLGRGKLNQVYRIERIDDVVLLLKKIQKLEIGRIIDEELLVHGNWVGLSVGKLTEVWLAYLLSEGDHRLNRLEGWAKGRKYMLQSFYPDDDLDSSSFTDDKLELVLDYLDGKGTWKRIEKGLNKRILRVYKIAKEKKGLKHVRLDATIGKGHKKVKEGGLFQFGHSKHFNPKLPQFKTMLSTLDTEIRGQSYPLCSITVSGNTSDDVLYQPIIKQSKESLGEGDKLLIVGDKKLGSEANLSSIVEGGDYYLTPLSKVQVSGSRILDHVKEARGEASKIQPIVIETEEIGEEFEIEYTHTVNRQIGGKEEIISWTERRMFVRTWKQVAIQKAALLRRIGKAKAGLDDLLVKKQGKQALDNESAIQEKVDSLLQELKAEDYFEVKIHRHTTTKKKRKYGNNPARTIREVSFSLEVDVKQSEIDQAIENLAWVVYATNAPEQSLPGELAELKLKDALILYKEQFQIETRFNDLKNKVTKLLPLFLQKDHRIKGLINLMMIALKITCLLEVKVAKTLKDNGKKLKGLTPGNPSRKTPNPTAKMLLNRFKGLSFTIVFQDDVPISLALTPLDSTQKEILELMGIPTDLYEQQLIILNSFFNEQFKRT